MIEIDLNRNVDLEVAMSRAKGLLVGGKAEAEPKLIGRSLFVVVAPVYE